MNNDITSTIENNVEGAQEEIKENTYIEETEINEIENTVEDSNNETSDEVSKEAVKEKKPNLFFDKVSQMGDYLLFVFIKTLSIPVILIANLGKFIWKHTAIFRHTMVRMLKGILSMIISPAARLFRIISKNRSIAQQAKENGDIKKANKVNAFIVKELLIGKHGLFPTIANYAAPIISIVFLVGIVTYATSTTYALKLSVNGKFIGYVENEQVFTEAEKLMQKRITFNDDSGIIDLEPKYSIEMLGDQEKLTKYQLVNKLMEVLDVKIEYAYGVYIGKTFYGAVIDTTKIDAEMERILASYSTGARDEIITPEKEISYEPALYPAENIVDEQEIIDLLNSSKKEASYYTVAEGDTVSGIAEKFGITVDELTELNAKLKNKDYVPAKDEKLLVTKDIPFLSVSVSGIETYTVEVPYKTEYTTDDDHYQGVKTIIREGVNGKNNVTARVYYVNGIEKKREIKSTITISEPVTEIVSEGTRAPQSTHYSNATADQNKKYIWPVFTHDIWEWGWWDGGYYGHTGVDIGGIYGSDIYAAASGEVTYAGWDNGGYGNMVMILHPDGYTTLYAHCSAIYVSVGQQVITGQCIAALGATGRATGDHCHFEVRLGSERLNPKYYLSGLPS